NGIKYNSREDKKIEVGYRTDDNSFFVRDNGIGISKEFHNDVFRIFKRLNRHKAFGGGSGAGLTFVKKIVENHGGRIWIESEGDLGTTFYFTLKGKAA
ncbi:MAG: sensor histidine kinase, partial [Methyloligellaceae bacterium]